MLITVIAFHHIEVGNLGSWLNNKYGEKDEREACRLNLYPITMSPNLEYGTCEDHAFVNPTSPSTQSI